MYTRKKKLSTCCNILTIDFDNIKITTRARTKKENILILSNFNDVLLKKEIIRKSSLITHKYIDNIN